MSGSSRSAGRPRLFLLHLPNFGNEITSLSRAHPRRVVKNENDSDLESDGCGEPRRGNYSGPAEGCRHIGAASAVSALHSSNAQRGRTGGHPPKSHPHRRPLVYLVGLAAPCRAPRRLRRASGTRPYMATRERPVSRRVVTDEQCYMFPARRLLSTSAASSRRPRSGIRRAARRDVNRMRGSYSAWSSTLSEARLAYHS
jgi:hypothetical protein